MGACQTQLHRDHGRCARLFVSAIALLRLYVAHPTRSYSYTYLDCDVGALARQSKTAG